MRTARRTVVLFTLAILLLAPIATASAGESEEGTSEEEPALTDEEREWAEQFEQELMGLLEEAGADGEGAPSLIGEPGDLDLPPGELTLLGLMAVAPEPPAGDGSSLVGPCQGLAISFDGDGNPIDMAADFNDGGPPIDLYDGGQAFTAENPYEVNVNGYVAYAGKADPAPLNHTWYIRVQGLNLDSGGDDNPDAENRNAGTVDLGSELPAPAKVNALFRIEGQMVADGGFFCSGEGYFRTTGGAPVLQGAGAVLLLAAGIGALFNARPARTWRA